jgi:hypothetical protein
MFKEPISIVKQNIGRVRKSPADCSTVPTHEKSLFLRHHDYWIIRYHRHTAFFKSARGLRYLAVLLQNPGREFHVRELLARSLDSPTLSAAGTGYGQGMNGLYAGLPVLDAEAKA